MDIYSSEKRKTIMTKVKAGNTKPELILRSCLYKAGYRFRLHMKDLPGKPDIVLTKYKTVIFVNGCFWHQHEGCKKATIPHTNSSFWTEKLRKNVERDDRVIDNLTDSGWKVIIVWECEMKKNLELVMQRIQNNLVE